MFLLSWKMKGYKDHEQHFCLRINPIIEDTHWAWSDGLLKAAWKWLEIDQWKCVQMATSSYRQESVPEVLPSAFSAMWKSTLEKPFLPWCAPEPLHRPCK